MIELGRGLRSSSGQMYLLKKGHQQQAVQDSVQSVFEHCWKHSYCCRSGRICLLCHKGIFLAYVQLGVHQNSLGFLCKDVLPVCAGLWHVPSQMQIFAHFLVELSCWETCCSTSPTCCGLLDGSRTLCQIRQSQFCIPSTLSKGTLLHHSDNDIRVPFQANSNIMDISQLFS